MLCSFPGGSVRGPMVGTEVHPRFPWGKAQDQFSLFLPAFVNAGISHHHPASVPYLDFWGSFLPLLPYFVPLFWVWRQGSGVCVCVCVHECMCNVRQVRTCRGRKWRTMYTQDVCKGLLEWASSVCLLSGLAFCIIHAPLSQLALPNTSQASLTS